MARVLLVEDDRDIAEPLTRALAREGYDVAEAGDGRVALEGVLAAPPDLIILDVGLPGIDGLEVCRCVRDLHPQLPILMLTARDGELETVRRAGCGRRRLRDQAVPLVGAARAHPGDAAAQRAAVAAGGRRLPGRVLATGVARRSGAGARPEGVRAAGAAAARRGGS